MQNLDSKLDAVFAAYRASMPDRDASAAFMPGLWQRIEARQNSGLMFRRLTGALVGAAAIITLLMAAVLIPRYQNSQVYSATYVDVLAAEHSEDIVAVDAVAGADVLGARR
ncbi:MAG: hypothetical protein ABI823_02640 [Bryobacteraceae bacterium]